MAVLFGGYVTDKIGRKLSIILCSIPYTIGWLLIVVTVKFTNSPAFRPIMFSGRFIVGLSVGWTSLCVNVRTTIWVFTLERLKFYDVGSLDDFIGLIFCNFT